MNVAHGRRLAVSARADVGRPFPQNKDPNVATLKQSRIPERKYAIGHPLSIPIWGRVTAPEN